MSKAQNDWSYGISDELINLLKGITEASYSGELKYRAQDANEFHACILNRKYYSICYELSFLIHALTLLDSNQLPPQPSSILEFFWSSPTVRPSFFCSYFSKLRNSEPKFIKSPKNTLNYDSNKLSIHFEDVDFTITSSRTGILTAMMEFISSIDFMFIDSLGNNTLSTHESSVRQLSQQMQKILFQYLADKLQPAKQQKRFSLMFKWVLADSRRFDPTFINDEQVIQFWINYSHDPKNDLCFRLFKTVVDNFIVFLKSLTVASTRNEIQQAASIGYGANDDHSHDHDINPEHLSDDSDTLAYNEPFESTIPFETWLTEYPKCFTKQHFELLSPIVNANKHAFQLPISLARRDRFGQWQSEIGRSTGHQGAAQMDQRLNLESSAKEDYQDLMLHYQAARDDMANSLFALLHIFLHYKQLSSVAAVMLHLINCFPNTFRREQKKGKQPAPDEIINPIALDALNATHQQGFSEAMFDETINETINETNSETIYETIDEAASPAERGIEQIEQLFKQLDIHPDKKTLFGQLIWKAKKQWTKNRKQGFQELPNIDQMPIYIRASEIIIKVDRQIDSYISSLEKSILQHASFNQKDNTNVFDTKTSKKIEDRKRREGKEEGAEGAEGAKREEKDSTLYEQLFALDFKRFQQQFKRIYGERHEHAS